MEWECGKRGKSWCLTRMSLWKEDEKVLGLTGERDSMPLAPV